MDILDTYAYYEGDLATSWSEAEAAVRDPFPPGCGCETWDCQVCPPPWGSAGETTR